jgi:hypothetical protein
MNEPFDPLEVELASLQPHEPSPDLRRRIADELAADAPVRSMWVWFTPRTPIRRIAVSAIFAGLAAWLVAAFLLRSNDRPPITEPRTEIPQPPMAAAFDDGLPSVWVYQRALSRSPRDVEALLDRHAALRQPPPGRSSAHLFIGTDSDLLLQGEL